MRKKDKNDGRMVVVGQERDQEKMVKSTTKMTPPDRIMKPQERLVLGYRQSPTGNFSNQILPSKLEAKVLEARKCKTGTTVLSA